jgi:hypothetical protein
VVANGVSLAMIAPLLSPLPCTDHRSHAVDGLCNFG